MFHSNTLQNKGLHSKEFHSLQLAFTLNNHMLRMYMLLQSLEPHLQSSLWLCAGETGAAK